MGRVTVDLTRDVKTKLFRILENHRLCLQGATKIGCHLVNISGEDIVQGKPYLVFGLLWQVIRAGLLYHINIRDHPELMRLFSSADEDLRNVPAETLLLRWLNWHLARSGFSGEIKNFGSDLADSRAYLHLLHSLQHAQLVQPNQLQAALAIADDLGRAECMLAYANELDPRSSTFLRPADVVAGSEKLNLCFIANLFNKGSGMSALHEELESKNRLLETELKTVSSTAADLSHLVAELRARISDLELENGQLKKQLSERQVAYVSLEQEKTKVSETFSEAVVHWKSAQTQFEKEIQLLQEQVQGTAQSLAKTKKELASERRQAETFGICADSLSGELEGFRSRQEKMEYLIEHLKLERVRSDRHVTRLR